MSLAIEVKFFYPVLFEGKRLSTANIIWAERDRGSAYYRTSKFAMNGGKFPSNHPCAPFDDVSPPNTSQIGGSKELTAFRSLGYWASCFPEGDGITMKWWDQDTPLQEDKTPEQVMDDIRACFPNWIVIDGNKAVKKVRIA
jgi:hypothetical protein